MPFMRCLRRVLVVAILTTMTGPGLAQEIWCPNPAVAVFEGPDYSGRNDDTCAIRIVGARNGRFTGQAVAFFKEQVKGTPAQVGDLKLRDGAGVIPASAIQLLYALPTGGERDAGKRFPGVKGLRRFDAFSPAPQEEPARTHPVWLKVRVPADAKPGEYCGELALAGRKVPVKLSVAGWALPDPVRYRTHVNIIQSPESVALRYEVPMWSDKHVELIGKSFDLMAEVGNKVVYIPLICETHFGNPESMVRWIRDGEKWKHDFSVVEKYLDLYIKRVGKPQFVCFYAWDHYAGGAHFGNDAGGSGKPIRVSRLDPDSGKVETIDGPPHGGSGSEEFWKPVMDGLRERLKTRGIGDSAILVGIGGDLLPSKATVTLFHTVAPYARWMVNAHGPATRLYDKVDVGCLVHVWAAGRAPDPDKAPDRAWKKNRYYGWTEEQVITVFPRFGGRGWFMYPPLWWDAPLGVYRAVCEAAISAPSGMRGMNGVGRLGADFWPAIKDAKGNRQVLLNRYPGSNWSQLTVNNAVADLLSPGPDGARSTVRFEILREGVQECEAKIFIEGALLDKDKAARLGEEMAKKCDEVLKERLRCILRSDPDQKGWEWFAAESGWQDRAEQLFSAAAGLAAKLGDGK